MLSGFTPVSRKDAYEAVKDFEKEIEKVPEGATTFDMLDPESQHYIVDDVVKRHISTLMEQIEQITQTIILQDADARKPEESITDYEKRIK
jgi:uncharacterized protein Yka (UPF0111/DUF47 family)